MSCVINKVVHSLNDEGGYVHWDKNYSLVVTYSAHIIFINKMYKHAYKYLYL